MLKRDRKYPLSVMATARKNVHSGTSTIFVPDGFVRSKFSTALRAYFVAFGDKVKISKVGDDDEIYIRLEKR